MKGIQVWKRNIKAGINIKKRRRYFINMWNGLPCRPDIPLKQAATNLWGEISSMDFLNVEISNPA